jgi:8-amino-7-oxononanoate synthase
MLARTYDAILYVDDRHGFGVVGERSREELCPYGRRGNGVVRHLGERYDNVVLTAGFSKAYSSLLAFIACRICTPGHPRSPRWPARCWG